MTSTVRRWPLFLIAAPAAVSIWSGWVGLGGRCGFGIVHPLPGIVPGLRLDTAITLPIGVEAYGAYALGAWLTLTNKQPARTFARRSAIGALLLGMLGQVAFHILAASHAARAPWPIVVLVSCMPVVTLGFGAALTHLLRVVPERQPAQITTLTPPPGSAEEAAIVAYRASVAGGNPLSERALSDRYGISRPRARKLRSEVDAAAANGSTAPGVFSLSRNGDS